MPIYEYACDSCGHTFEALQKMSDPKLTDCPACQQASLRKLVSASGFQLKGTGWYQTDFRGNKPAASGSNASSGNTGSSTEASPTAPATGCGSGSCGHKH